MMTAGPWGLAVLDLVVVECGAEQGGWVLVSLVLAVEHVWMTRATWFSVVANCVFFLPPRQGFTVYTLGWLDSLCRPDWS